MKVFVTGATGFIGGHLVKRLAAGRHALRCLVRKGSRSQFLQEIGAELVIGDVTDKNSVLQGMKGCDSVANLANIYTLWEPDKSVYHTVNVIGTRNVMESALESGVSKVVHVSTLAVYGQPADRPFAEGSQMGPKLFSEYARSKHAGDQIAWKLTERGLPLVVIYPGIVLGPGDPKASGQFIKNIVNKKMPAKVFPNSVFTCVYVGDVAEAIKTALEKDGNVGERYLIGKESLSFGEVMRTVCETAGVPQPKISLPNGVTIALAAFLSGVSSITKRPPWLGLSLDQARAMRNGEEFDGSKAERELGLTYTPIRRAIAEAVESYQT